MKTQVSAQTKKLTASLAFIAIVASTWVAPAWAATQTVTLSVSGMTCAACPITVKKSLTRIDGVSKAEVSYKKSEAVVTFDDTSTSVQALIEATKNAGYPSSLKE